MSDRTCAALAQRYAQETGNTIPSSGASTETKEAWLLTQTWGCIPPGDTAFYPAASGKCEELNDFPPPAYPANTLSSRPPKYNKLQETGFLAWVNERGLQCVNRLVGNFYGLDTATGLAKQPGPNTPPPDSKCWGACLNATVDSDMCFECVHQELTADPQLCPQIKAGDSQDQNLVRDALGCHACIGSQAKFLTESDTKTPDRARMLNNMWKCVEGTVPKKLTTMEWVMIALAGAMVLAVAITLAVWYGIIRPRHLKAEQKRRQLQKAGLNPNDY